MDTIENRRIVTIENHKIACYSTSIVHRELDIYLDIEAEKNGSHFPDDIFKCIFLNENMWISVKISPKFVPEGPINNILALDEVMAGAGQATSHSLNQWWLAYWRIYASLGHNELIR